jgi:hypothetical protein
MAPPAASGHPVPGRLEQALALAQLGQHQHGCQEPDGGAEVAQLAERPAGRQDAERDRQRGGGDRRDRLRQVAGPHHREGQGAGQQQERDGLRERRRRAEAGEHAGGVSRSRCWSSG